MGDKHIDTDKQDIYTSDRTLLEILLCDRTSGKSIIWATDNYADKGVGYSRFDPITVDAVTGYNGEIVKPRIIKTKQEQLHRARDKAEVFTPAWICNKQNNLVDNAWFGQESVFNVETGTSWDVTASKISFPTATGKSWKAYIEDVRLEIACGEAPYLTSRYDAVSGEPIALVRRIGMLDRKLRVVSENTTSKKEWMTWTVKAFQSIYGYDWHGDNVLMARKNLLFTFVDHYQAAFGKKPPKKSLMHIADILSWNIWQMDGIKCVIPDSCRTPCKGCAKNKTMAHTGQYCMIKDWKTDQTVRFADILKE